MRKERDSVTTKEWTLLSGGTIGWENQEHT